MVGVPNILPSSAHSISENSCAKLTSSGEITELEVLLKKKKKEKFLIETQYEPLVDFIAQEIARLSLDYKLVLFLVEEHFTVQ
jgi:hypothetical protein